MTDNEIKINQNTNEMLTLDQLITEGTDALILYKFTYPNTDKEIGVKIRPISNPELNTAINSFKSLGTSIDIEILRIALYNPDDTPVDYEIIKKLPAGIVTELSLEIGRISGIERNKEEEEKLTEKLMGF